jgi:hypothetical protein
MYTNGQIFISVARLHAYLGHGVQAANSFQQNIFSFRLGRFRAMLKRYNRNFLKIYFNIPTRYVNLLLKSVDVLKL